VAEVAIYTTAFVAKLLLQTLPGGEEYGVFITGVGAVLIAKSGVKAVKLSHDLDRMHELDRKVMHEHHKENVEELKQALQQCGEFSGQAYTHRAA
jgi:peroxiredoxin family protein